MSDGSYLISAGEAARLLGFSKPIVYQFAKREDFLSFNIGNRVLISQAKLERWVAEHLEHKMEVAL